MPEVFREVLAGEKLVEEESDRSAKRKKKEEVKEAGRAKDDVQIPEVVADDGEDGDEDEDEEIDIDWEDVDLSSRRMSLLLVKRTERVLTSRKLSISEIS